MMNELKYNLYEVLGVSKSASEEEIKYNYTQLIKTFHPDRSSKLSLDIYHHILSAGSILLDKYKRKTYNNIVENSTNTFNDLKSNSNDNLNNVKYIRSYAEINKELDDVHGYSNAIKYSYKPIDELYYCEKNKRDSSSGPRILNEDDIKQIKKEIASHTITEYKGPIMEQSSTIIGNEYTLLEDAGILYKEDNIVTPYFTSINLVF
jgi:curved DNA-binding protein CbpA